jgi:multiple sugar transport system permease protein
MADITAAATAVARRSTGAGSDIWRKLAPYLFLLPFLIVFIGFLVVPLVYAFNLSVWKTTLVGGTHFVGFDNYAKAIVDAKFWGGVLTLLKFAAMQIPVMLALALLFALILDSGMVYLKSFFRISFFIPYAVPTVIATLLWGYLYSPSYGPAAQIAAALNIQRIDFFQPNTILPSIANIAVWEYMGYNMIIYFAALQAIPQDLEEASVVDGAGAFAHAIYVKLPLIVPTIMVTIIFSIIGTLQLFAEPYLLYNLARSIISSYFTPNFYAYTLAFVAQQYNYSAAISFLLGAVTAVISYVFMLLTSRRSAR